jgi:hypothetical protein
VQTEDGVTDADELITAMLDVHDVLLTVKFFSSCIWGDSTHASYSSGHSFRHVYRVTQHMGLIPPVILFVMCIE